ncbi:P-loop containing nucleoside triphosphate hydrolase protein [Lineolata rhizophorae]|uniref:P-loop containing nucleoside triphosphate hydrolase protein n=1 Tax=Lineolata rhizophorae TaxID=578093 RepID=A0A6A6PEB2_9PEZI|nr:P-loop containing nucleoside triphosphate hydrolase protein [Lineolata rhizophorae]
MPEIVDDKSPHCIPFIVERIKAHQNRFKDQSDVPPFFLGINGVQGAGKSTLVSALSQTLESPPHSLPTAVLSIDDLYLTHADQRKLASDHPSNPLIQHRGEPGTHDIRLGAYVLDALAQGRQVKLPRYEKAAFDGEGDRADPATWAEVNGPGQPRIQVVVFEGWCVAFRPLTGEALRERWEDSRKRAAEGVESVMARHGLENLAWVNEALKAYDTFTDKLDALIHIDAEDTKFVYRWRLEQEAELRRLKGKGMTNEQVVKFVDGYYPAYELFTDTLRVGVFGSEHGKQLRLIVGEDRKVKKVLRI